MDTENLQPETRFVHEGRAPQDYAGMVNPPLFRASTVLFPSVAAMMEAEKNWHAVPYYGRHGTPSTFAFEQSMADLEGGYRAIAVSSGTAALTTAIAAFVKAGDHILTTDGAYAPTRKFCENFLQRFGVETTYYPPTLSAEELAPLIRPNTKVLFLESPSSLTMEMQDVPALCALAKQHKITTILDNTWSTPLHCKAFALGVDVSVHSATKYILGHSDAMLGVITTTENTYLRVKQAAALFGHHAAPEEIYLAQRGLRTLPVRLKQQAETAFTLMTWISQRAEVAQILSPSWQEDVGFALWQRDCTGGAGLFSFALQPQYTQQHCHAFIDALQLFGIGFSWGGYESLALPVNLQGIRANTAYPDNQRIRLSMGLENAIDLQHDLEKGFAALNALS